MRKILHADCDCFYAAVEMRDDPSLRDIPIAIGGRPEQRGVVATCNYPARRFGVHSAMSSAQALRLCPQLRLIPPDFERYRQVSAEIMTIFQQLTDRIEPLSLDEAFLDISGIERFKGSGTWMAEWLKARTREVTGITISVGVAPNKFLAKIASDWRKPDGLYVITPDQVDAFVSAMPVGKLPGVGPATAARLEQMGIADCQALRQRPIAELIDHFGKFGRRLYELSRGIDEREVKTHRERKSVSVETTFDRDIDDQQARCTALAPLVERLAERLARHGAPSIGKLFVKVRFDDFTSTTLESGGLAPQLDNFITLFDQAWQRGQRPIRLLGVGVRLADAALERQLVLFEEPAAPQ
ncbi:DNA polymerase IV [Halotalea alkalilenta]|uniref:DNA polymerase IV n=1 Tax=Halotalea alkalilenta TaxID=376489 RepID=A0A172YEW8_9GAMM|nr:DNA polymerase IV [Halotalea alkalilenta]ANF57656.1 DNA polymerase IV [Halotalea alkalilenta]